MAGSDPIAEPSPPGNCRWCGEIHDGPRCPWVKALEFDPCYGSVSRVEFLTPADFGKAAAEVQPQEDDYPKLGGKR